MRWLLLLCLALPLRGQILRCGDVGCMTNPMSNTGDIIVGGSAGVPTRLGVSTGYLHWNGTNFVYDTPPAGAQQVTSDPSGSCTVGTSLQYNNTNGKLWGCDAGVWSEISGGGGGGSVSCGPGASILCTVAGSNTQLDANPAIVPFNAGAHGIQTGGSPIVCVDSSSSTTAYTLACGQPAPPYTTNQAMFCFFNTTNSTTTPTAALDTRAALTIVNGDGTAAATSSIKPGLPYTCSYDGTNLRLAQLGLSGTGSTVTTFTGFCAGTVVSSTNGANLVGLGGNINSPACNGAAQSYWGTVATRACTLQSMYVHASGPGFDSLDGAFTAQVNASATSITCTLGTTSEIGRAHV